MAKGLVYNKNCFFIENRGHKANNGDSISPFFRNNESKEGLRDEIAFNHELNHYIQDLSINACITEGFFIDSFSAYSNLLTHVKSLRFPLLDNDNRQFNIQQAESIGEKNRDYLNMIYKLNDIYEYIFKESYTKPESDEYKLGIFRK